MYIKKSLLMAICSPLLLVSCASSSPSSSPSSPAPSTSIPSTSEPGEQLEAHEKTIIEMIKAIEEDSSYKPVIDADYFYEESDKSYWTYYDFDPSGITYQELVEYGISVLPSGFSVTDEYFEGTDPDVGTFGDASYSSDEVYVYLCSYMYETNMTLEISAYLLSELPH